MAIGNPLGYDFSITSGIVSATGRTCSRRTARRIPNGIQTDAAINQGNSGGPLINTAGKVIGINEQIASQSGGNEGLGFAVPINTAISSMEPAQGERQGQVPWMGVQHAALTTDIAKALNIKSQSGALVDRRSSPAAPRPRPASRAGASR